ncbi:hypothetical protein L9F63_025293, partial [Diploptera punctata]
TTLGADVQKNGNKAIFTNFFSETHKCIGIQKRIRRTTNHNFFHNITQQHYFRNNKIHINLTNFRNYSFSGEAFKELSQSTNFDSFVKISERSSKLSTTFSRGRYILEKNAMQSQAISRSGLIRYHPNADFLDTRKIHIFRSQFIFQNVECAQLLFKQMEDESVLVISDFFGLIDEIV